NQKTETDLFENLYAESKKFITYKTSKSENIDLQKFIEILQNNERFYLKNDLEKANFAYFERLKYAHSIYRSEEHTSELQSRENLSSFPTRRSSDLIKKLKQTYLKIYMLNQKNLLLIKHLNQKISIYKNSLKFYKIMNDFI